MQADRTRVGAYVLCRDDDGRILLTRFVDTGSPHSGWWTMPGGATEWGEQPEDTAVREVFEETGLSVDLVRILAVRSEWISPPESLRGDHFHAVQVIYEGANPRGALRVAFDEGDTTDAAAWFTIDEARALERVALVDFCLDRCDSSG